MDDSVKMILKKLDEIDGRLKGLEGQNLTPLASLELGRSGQVGDVKREKIERDPLFSKALEIMDKHDEISSKMLAEGLKIDVKRAEVIMDQMEAAGLGTCYTKEV